MMNQRQKDQRELAYLESQFDAKERDLKVLGEKIREIKNRLQVKVSETPDEYKLPADFTIRKEDTTPIVF